MRLAALALLMLAWAGPAAAAGMTCGGAVVFGAPNDLTLYRVKEKTNFIGDAQVSSACPSADMACLRKGFVVAGDFVLGHKDAEGLVCASFVNARGVETAGYLPAAKLDAMSMAPAPGDWVGEWRRDAEASIRIKAAAGGLLDLAGEATFGARDPARVKRGAVNSGEIRGEAKPRGGRIALGEDYDGEKPPAGLDQSDCKARLRLMPPYLVIDDNGGCGGANVSFTGVYRRLPER